jgi:hypothetical protein
MENWEKIWKEWETYCKQVLQIAADAVAYL